MHLYVYITAPYKLIVCHLACMGSYWEICSFVMLWHPIKKFFFYHWVHFRCNFKNFNTWSYTLNAEFLLLLLLLYYYMRFVWLYHQNIAWYLFVLSMMCHIILNYNMLQHNMRLLVIYDQWPWNVKNVFLSLKW